RRWSRSRRGTAALAKKCRTVALEPPAVARECRAGRCRIAAGRRTAAVQLLGDRKSWARSVGQLLAKLGGCAPAVALLVVQRNRWPSNCLLADRAARELLGEVSSTFAEP